MNISKFTQKSLQAVNECEKIAYEYGNQEIEQEHLLYSLLTQEDSLIWKLIEKMEIKRFNALLMRTIVGMLFMGVLMWETFCLDTGRKGFLGETWYIFAFAVLLYVVVAIRASDILEGIKKDKKLMGALDSEIYSDYNSKALTAGFYAAMQMGLLVYCFGDFFNLSVRMGALVIVVVAMLFSEIRRLLLYNPYKDGK